MNDFAAAIAYNVPSMNTPSVRAAMDTMAAAADRHADRDLVLCGFRLLTATEPDRLPNLIAWLATGRADLVASVLADFYDHERVTAYHGRIGTTVRSC